MIELDPRQNNITWSLEEIDSSRGKKIVHCNRNNLINPQFFKERFDRFSFRYTDEQPYVLDYRLHLKYEGSEPINTDLLTHTFKVTVPVKPGRTKTCIELDDASCAAQCLCFCCCPCRMICSIRDCIFGPTDNENQIFTDLMTIVNNVIEDQLTNADRETERRIKAISSKIAPMQPLPIPPGVAVSSEEVQLLAEIAQLQAAERIRMLKAEKERLRLVSSGQ